jgi:hypothetical protein
MRRGTRATREEDGEGERNEGREDESSLRFVVENALLLVAAAVCVVVFFRFVCFGKAIPIQRRARHSRSLSVTLSLACRAVLSSNQILQKETL